MKVLFSKIFLYTFFVTVFISCTTNIINLQEVELQTPIVRNPIKIVKNKERGRIELNANFSINEEKNFYGKIDGHTTVNAENIYELTPVEGQKYFYEYSGNNIYDFNGNNFTWGVPSYLTSLDLDLTLSQYFAITLGTKYSSINENSFWGHNFGLAYFQEEQNWAIRFDTFLKYQQVLYNITYITAEDISLEENVFRKVYVYNKTDEDQYYNVGFMLSLNTKNEDWPVNLYGNYSFGWQTFYQISIEKFNPNFSDGSFEHEEYYHSFTFGAYQDISKIGRIVLGYSLTNYEHNDKSFFLPGIIMQFDVFLF